MTLLTSAAQFLGQSWCRYSDIVKLNCFLSGTNRWKKYSFSIPGSSCELKDKLFSVDAEILAKAAGIVRKDMFLHKGLNFS